MAIKIRVLVALFFVFALANANEVFTEKFLKGSVTCLDCTGASDLSGIQVLVKCDKVKKLAMAYTEEDGSFQTELPSDSPTKASSPSNCMAKIMGGPFQLFAQTSNSITKITKSNTHFTISKPLSFYKSCPAKAKCGNEFASSKTVDLPLPREWGFAPTSYYVPFVPIIGIP